MRDQKRETTVGSGDLVRCWECHDTSRDVIYHNGSIVMLPKGWRRKCIIDRKRGTVWVAICGKDHSVASADAQSAK